MPPDETGSPRKPRGPRKAAAPPTPFADDWPLVTPAAAGTGEPVADEPPAERQRIARAIARAGLCSRREAEDWIVEGRVSVNGERLASPARDVGPDDRVEVDGAPLPQAEKTRLFLFHKPRGLVTSNHDPEGRATVADHLREHWPEGPRVVTIGRLDINTEGLLLLTNDGGLARMLELPKTGWLRRYRVRANGTTDQAQLDALADGLTLDGVDYAGIEAKLDRVQGSNCWLTMGLREGKNREIKRVLEHLGLEVNRLIRLSFGPFQLLDLPEGAVEEVRTRVLRDQLGPALAAEAGAAFDEAPTATPEDRNIAQLRKDLPRKDAPRREAASREHKPDKSARREPSPEKSAREPRERSAKPAPRAPTRSGDGRPGERTLRRRTPEATPAAPQERPQGRPRRHVSTLRTSEGEATRAGPRKRIERSDTRDRHDRTVTVERKVSARPPRVSPSAAGKRARIARSGARREPAEGAPVRGERPTQRSGEGRAPFRRPSSSGAAENRPASGREAPQRAPRPRRDAGERGAGARFERSGERQGRDGGARDGGFRNSRSRDGAAREGTRPPRRGDAAGSPRGGPRSDERRDRPEGGARDRGFSARSPRGGGAPKPGGRDRSPKGDAPGGGRPGGKRPSGGARPGGGGRPGGGSRSGGPRPGGRPSGGKPPRGGGGAPGRPKR